MTSPYIGHLIWRGAITDWLDYNITPPTSSRTWLAGCCTACRFGLSAATVAQHALRCSHCDDVEALQLYICVDFTAEQWRRFHARNLAYVASLCMLNIRCSACNIQLTSVTDLERHFATHYSPPATPPPAPARPRSCRQRSVCDVHGEV